MKPRARENEILVALAWNGSAKTNDVARNVTRATAANAEQHSKFVYTVLLDLERRGLVCRLDDQEPIRWCNAATERRT